VLDEVLENGLRSSSEQLASAAKERIAYRWDARLDAAMRLGAWTTRRRCECPYLQMPLIMSPTVRAPPHLRRIGQGLAVASCTLR
jgi:hypothetical protein